MKTVVIGLDGANWDLLDEWIEEGELPNLKKLREEGVWADSKSELPPVTFPNWQCYFTGRNPSKLNVYWFERFDKKDNSLKTVNSSHFEGKNLADYLGKKYKTGIINLPGTYPPKKVNGFLVSGGPNTREREYRKIGKGFTYPLKLSRELKEKGYRVHPENLPTSKNDKGKEVEDILEILKKRFEIAEEKLDEVDFLHLTLFYLNTLQHFFWRGEPTKRAWKLIDDELGKWMNKDVNLILMSDHGCCKIDTVFYVNSWLEEKGYLKTKETTEDIFLNLGINKEKAYSLAKKLGLSDFLTSIVPEELQKIVPREQGVMRERRADKIDWDGTVAFGGNQGIIYVLDGDRGEEIRKELKGLRTPDGRKIAKDVYKFEEVYSESPNNYSPDIIIDQREGVNITAAISHEKVFETETQWKAENKRTGLFLGYGESFKSGKINQVSILDLAPTILHMYSLPIPSEMDGRIIKKALK